MTSWMECGCGGDVTLYEYPGEERFGRKWFLLKGSCKQCGRYYETVPTADLKEFRRLMEEDEIRQFREQKEREVKEYNEYLESLTPKELLNELGPEHYPWIYLVFENVMLPEGQTRTLQDLGHTSYCLTLADAYRSATLYLRPNQHCRIEQNHEIIDEWTYGDRDFERFIVSVHYDYIVRDTGEVRESTSCGIRELTVEEAKEKADEEAMRCLGGSSTFFDYWIKDKDGNVVYQRSMKREAVA